MDEELSPHEKEKKIQAILIIILVAISISAVSLLILLYEPIQGSTELVYTTTFRGIDPYNTSKLINTNEHLVIVDIRSCKCDYNKGHLPNAIWNTNPHSFDNETNDLLIFDRNGSKSIEFCEKLVGHTYGALYYLEGGMLAWRVAKYPIE